VKIIKWNEATSRDVPLCEVFHGKKDGVPEDVMERAQEIFSEVILQGDPALFRYTLRFERHNVDSQTIRVSYAEKEKALARVPEADRGVIELAARRIRAYHKKQKPKGARFNDKQGTLIEERVVPLDRVGLCIPGGRFPLASTVLMTAIPAKLAGVKELIMINPWPEGKMNPHVIFAAVLAGVDKIFKAGGVQGVAALAVGTGSIPKVDKIVGPGSAWVTAAKAIAFSRGLCGVDSLAGPSEVVILAGRSADPELIAVDMLSQAEHGEGAFATLVTASAGLAEEVARTISRLLSEHFDREKEAEEIQERLSALVVKDMSQAIEKINDIAPEHLEIITQNPRKLLPGIKNAASIFIGPYSPVPAGDYMAGGNHVLPTGGTARFSSPLSVHDFVKRQSVTTLSDQALRSIQKPVARFAEIEGLEFHALSIMSRFRKQG